MGAGVGRVEEEEERVVTMNHDIGADIEVKADEFEDQQVVLRKMAIENADRDKVEATTEFFGFNSCDALRIIDGVVKIEEEDEE